MKVFHTTPAKPPLTPETFIRIYKHDVEPEHIHHDAPPCPLARDAGYIRGSMSKCDVSDKLREFAIHAPGGHECGMCGKCPVRTYLNSH